MGRQRFPLGARWVLYQNLVRYVLPLWLVLRHIGNQWMLVVLSAKTDHRAGTVCSSLHFECDYLSTPLQGKKTQPMQSLFVGKVMTAIYQPFLWTRFRWLTSATRFCKQTGIPYSKCGRIGAPYNGMKADFERLWKGCLIMKTSRHASFAASEGLRMHCLPELLDPWLIWTQG